MNTIIIRWLATLSLIISLAGEVPEQVHLAISWTSINLTVCPYHFSLAIFYFLLPKCRQVVKVIRQGRIVAAHGWFSVQDPYLIHQCYPPGGTSVYPMYC